MNAYQMQNSSISQYKSRQQLSTSTISPYEAIVSLEVWWPKFSWLKSMNFMRLNQKNGESDKYYCLEYINKLFANKT